MGNKNKRVQGFEGSRGQAPGRFLKYFCFYLPSLLATCYLLLSFSVYAQSPHKAKDGCPACHVAPPASVETKDAAQLLDARKLVGGPVALCEGCHPDVHPGHITGVRTKINRNNLPLDSDGKITCAYTCHIMHPREETTHGKVLLRDDINVICLSCHDK